MNGITFYGIAELDPAGQPIKYLPFFGPGWTPGARFWMTADRAQAWRLGDRQTAEETADVLNSILGNGPELHVIELDGNGPPLTL